MASLGDRLRAGRTRGRRGVERPAVKGTALESAATDLRGLVEGGHLSREALEARLELEDLRILDGKLLPSEWYPIETYARILDLLSEVEGEGRPEYHVERGRRAAERLLRSGIYRQLDRAERMVDHFSHGAVVSILLTVGRALFNFGDWRVVSDEEREVRYEIAEADAFPEAARHTIQGFTEWAARHLVGANARVASHRPAPDRVEFRIEIV